MFQPNNEISFEASIRAIGDLYYSSIYDLVSYIIELGVSLQRPCTKTKNINTDNMKTFLFTLAIVLFTSISFGQTQTNPTNTFQQKKVSDNSIYQLFPTKNYWTFIKLDTRNGKMWQVHFSIEDVKNTGELILNSLSLVDKEEEMNGRFTLYPTENMYNFLLLDQISGIVVQVQWSLDAKKRGIVSVIKPIE